ncbi:MAG: hypothetical protein ACLUHE_05940 [Christensenellales bacterium]
MRNDEELRRLIHEAADACLSGVDAMPSRHDAIMHCIKKEKKVEKKKVSFALVCAIVLTLVLAGAAVAAGLVRDESLQRCAERGSAVGCRAAVPR